MQRMYGRDPRSADARHDDPYNASITAHLVDGKRTACGSRRAILSTHTNGMPLIRRCPTCYDQ